MIITVTVFNIIIIVIAIVVIIFAIVILTILQSYIFICNIANVIGISILYP